MNNNIFRKKRISKKITLAQLGSITNLSKVQIHNIETDKCFPSAKTLLTLMIILDIDAKEVYKYYHSVNWHLT